MRSKAYPGSDSFSADALQGLSLTRNFPTLPLPELPLRDYVVGKKRGGGMASPVHSSVRSSGNLNRDFPGLPGFHLRHCNSQDSILVLGLDLIGLDLGRKRDYPLEETVVSLYAVEVLLGVRDFVLPLAADYQEITLDANLDVVLIKPGQLDARPDLAVEFLEVHPGTPVALEDLALRRVLSVEVVDQTIHLIAERHYVPERSPSYDSHVSHLLS
jgi:hypothetical protein